MLSYFPTPYPDETWYSILCRYHIRSGNQNQLSTWIPGSKSSGLFPDHGLVHVLNQLPKELFPARSILMNHTLLPYYCRMQTLEMKRKILNDLEKGIQTEYSLESLNHRKPVKWKFCPECVKEELLRYGESYWHREHQIPYLSICRKHACRLSLYQPKGTRESEIGIILPNWCKGISSQLPVSESEIQLAEMLSRYLTLPYLDGRTEGYNNLYFCLERIYRKPKQKNLIVFDTERLEQDLLNRFEPSMIYRLFGKGMPKYIPGRIRNWEYITPERYAILAVLISQEPEVTFGMELPKESSHYPGRTSVRTGLRRIGISA